MVGCMRAKNENIIDDDSDETFTNKPRTVLQRSRLSSTNVGSSAKKAISLMARTDRLWHHRLRKAK